MVGLRDGRCYPQSATYEPDLYHLWSLFIDIAIDIANYRNRQFINLSFYFILYLSLGIVIRAPYVLPTATSLEPVVEMLSTLTSHE
jgi:hypothetical protein